MKDVFFFQIPIAIPLLKPDFCYMSDDDMSGFSKTPKLDPEDYYLGDGGYIIFTDKYLLKRGYCCKNSCKHCPYGFDKKKGRIIKE